jgi:hypothetical protein
MTIATAGDCVKKSEAARVCPPLQNAESFSRGNEFSDISPP